MSSLEHSHILNPCLCKHAIYLHTLKGCHAPGCTCTAGAVAAKERRERLKAQRLEEKKEKQPSKLIMSGHHLPKKGENPCPPE